MDLRLFEQSPHVASLLTRLYESHRLYGMARDSRPETRMELSGVMTRLLEHDLSGREQELVADVLITLIRQAERDLRQSLAEKLSKMERVPLRLVLHLVNDEIQVAEPMLRDSPVLSDLDLIYIIKSQGPAYWQAIATRHSLSDAVIDMLAATREEGTALALSQNDRIHLTGYALEILTAMAADVENLARPLLMREDMPPSLARKLYAHVGADLKDYIKAFYGIMPPDIEQAADEIILDFVDAVDPEKAQETKVPDTDFLPNNAVMASVKNLHAAGALTLNMMMERLKKGQIRYFIAMISIYSNIPPRRVLEMLRQPCGRKLAILCRAFDMQKGDFSTIYLLTHRIRSTDRLVNHRDLLTALTYFDRVKPDSARLVLARTGRAD